MGDAMTDETVAVDNDQAADDDTDQPEQGAPVGDGDEQETAVDAFVAGDEDDSPADSTSEPAPAVEGE